MSVRTLIFLSFLVLGLLPASLLAQDEPVPLTEGPAGDASFETETGDWTIAGRLKLGPTHFSYEERLPTLRSEYDEVGFASNTFLSGKIHGIVPYLEHSSFVVVGDEKFKSPGTLQKNDMLVEGHLLELGVGYDIEISEGRFVFRPYAAYTMTLMDFDRADFNVNGVDVTPLDLDGTPEEIVEEEFFGQGVTIGGRLSYLVTDQFELELRGSYTNLPYFRAVNEIGGTTHSDGWIFRIGASGLYKLGRRVAVGLSYDWRTQVIDNSGFEGQGGVASTAIVQLPNNDTDWGNIMLDIRVRF